MKLTLSLTIGKRPASIPRAAWHRWCERIGSLLAAAATAAIERDEECEELMHSMNASHLACSGPAAPAGDVVIYRQGERIGAQGLSDKGDEWIEEYVSPLPDAGFAWLLSDEDDALLAQLHAHPDLTVIEERIDE